MDTSEEVERVGRREVEREEGEQNEFLCHSYKVCNVKVCCNIHHCFTLGRLNTPRAAHGMIVS